MALKRVAGVQIPSTAMKRSVKEALDLADRAIADGKAQVAASRQAARRNPTDKTLQSAVRKNELTLARARSIRLKLRLAEKVANACCPLQVLFLDFEYFQAE